MHNSKNDSETGVSLGKTQDSRKSYFYLIDSEIMGDVENGTPASLKKAAGSLRKGQIETEEREKVLLSIVTDILKIVWPEERIEWTVPELSSETQYTGAIKSARDGFYNAIAGNNDFLSDLLPSLVVLTVDDVSDFFSQSESDLKNALERNSKSVLANYILGMLYFKHGDYEASADFLKTAYAGCKDSVQIVESYAAALKKSGRIKEAYSFILENLKNYPSNIKLLQLCAESSYELGFYENAEEYIARVLQQQPNNLPAVLFRIKILVKSQNFIRAASLLDMYARQDNSSKDYLILRAQIQYEWSKNNSDAVSTIEQALKLYSDDLEVMLFAAKLSGETMLPVAGKNADFYAEKVLEKQPDNPDALSYACKGFIQSENWEKAYDLSRHLMAVKKTDSSDILNHCKICIARKLYDEAYELILPLYKENSQDENLIQAYIDVLCASGRSGEARNIIHELMAAASSKLKSYLYYKKSFLDSSQDDILGDLRSSLISNPRNIDSLFRLYEIYYGRRDYRKAQYYLKQIVALNKDEKYKALNEQLSRLIK